ncbi:hypothetical protein CI102_9309 [Trichoderma harzianum]|uniref:Uncharacterized protein n=1 Tax=Trichoderma harzianum CBS 226.95 TaxID=983964 RepID=A0A2T4AFQ6_TRIHA|nr:hypothetical protein M431DRAFT_16191 [Trichoderma harzianum CBS 226.95]PKK47120.1 hypothetical protein CI102_9309 [Trichoderma harzianum]PTB55897.1 hypothetical protein M431DRAFT_16191 [Trichoderma harzianum CBS 226.95]
MVNISLLPLPTKRSDLYWAFSGGGAGTLGVVISMPSIVDGSSFTFNDPKVGKDAFWDAIGVFHAPPPPSLVGFGNSALYTCRLAPTKFALIAIAVPGAKLMACINALMKLFFDNLTRTDF